MPQPLAAAVVEEEGEQGLADRRGRAVQLGAGVIVAHGSADEAAEGEQGGVKGCLTGADQRRGKRSLPAVSRMSSSSPVGVRAKRKCWP